MTLLTPLPFEGWKGKKEVLTCKKVRPKARTFCKMNSLNPLRFTSHQRNWDKRLLFNFSKLQFLNDKIYSYIQKKAIVALGNLVFWSILSFKNRSFAKLKSKCLSQFLWWEVNLRGMRGLIFQKVRALGISG